MKAKIVFPILLCLLLFGCGKKNTATTPEPVLPDLPYENLTCWADSARQAEEIAQSYGIELCSYQLNIATYHTDEDPAQVIQRGKSQGLPELELNTPVDGE